MNVRILIAFLGITVSSSLYAQSRLYWHPANPWDSNSTHQVVWSSTPSIRYELLSSTNLFDWSTVTGFPIHATQSALAAGFDLTAPPQVQFFKMIEYDEQAPSIIDRHPDNGDFGILQESAITVSLSDVSGVDPASISLSISNLGTYAIGDAELSFTNNTITFNGSGTELLGSKGSNVMASLTVSDINGYGLTHLWSFRLELEPIENAEIIVLGSPEAQSMGQQLTAQQLSISQAVYPNAGPVTMAAPTASWMLVEVGTNHLLFAYSGSAPRFDEGDFVGNAAPEYLKEVFYRRVVSSTKNTASNTVTVITENVSMMQIMQQVSHFSFSSSGDVYTVAPDGQLIPSGASSMVMADASASVSIGGSFSHSIDFSGTPITCTLNGEWEFIPEITVAFDIEDAQLQDFILRVDGHSIIRVEPEISASGEYSKTVSTAAPIIRAGSLYLLGFAGLVPIWVDLEFELNAEVGVDVEAEATLSTGIQRDDSFYVGARYSRTNPGMNGWYRSPVSSSLETDPFECLIDGEGKAWAKLIPQLDVKLNSLFGAYANLTPELGLEGEGSVSNGELVSATFTLYGKIDANAGLAVTGISSGSLPSIDPWTLVNYPWIYQIPDTNEFAIVEHPQSIEVEPEESASLSCLAIATRANENPIDYQWFHDGTLVPDETNRTVTVPETMDEDAGEYIVRVSSGEETIYSEPARISIDIPFKMEEIPGGSNSGTNPPNPPPYDPHHWQFPSNYFLTVNTFYMDSTEILKTQWDKVHNWAVTNGYEFSIGSGHGRNQSHPVHTVSWHDCVKWCNARSEMDGRTPCYQTSGIYRTGEPRYPTCNFSSDGYRLPTSEEWEYAARGGVSSTRYPWGNTISHNEANYNNHPLYAWGGHPFTAPGGSFPSNGFGLFDICGNVSEWCWEYYYKPPDDVGEVFVRYFRGGDWHSVPAIGSWQAYPPDNRSNSRGFRCVTNTEPPPD